MRQVLNIANYETRHVFKDIVLFGMVFLIPLAYIAFFSCVYIAGILTDIPLGIVDLDNSKVSREITTTFKNCPKFKTIDSINTYDQLEKAMNNGTVRAGIVVPEDYAQKTSHRQDTKIMAVYDASNLIWGYNIKRYTSQVIGEIRANHTASYLAGQGYTEKEVKNIMSSISGNIEVWYNPTYNYTAFILPALIMMVLHQIGLLSVCLTVTREKENNCWLQYLCSPIARWKIFLGKALPYFIAIFFNYALLTWSTSYFIDLKIIGSTALIVLLGFLYSTFITSAGFFISTKVPNSLQATRYIMLLSIPMFIISGYTWPATHIPGFINFLARLLPFTWMAEGFRLVTLKELGFQYVNHIILILAAAAALSTILALQFKKRQKPREKGLTVNCGPTYPGNK
ncbi:MAG: ABC transporter permease [Clostridiales bacterium]|nr:ABC transporter permease [Clostridiales bacterium]MCF8023369.1 ABC transporter permease [Clostridiales bacterium]